jgi:hypothetical protein
MAVQTGTSAKEKAPKVVAEKKVDNSLKEQNDLLQKQLSEMQNQMATMMAQMNKQTETKTNQFDVNRWVEIVHLQEPIGGTTHISLSNRTIDLRKFGEVVSVRLTEFQELTSKYQTWFDKSIIAVSEKDSDLAEKYGVSAGKDGSLTLLTFRALADLSVEDLKKLYLNLSEGHRNLVTRTWANGYYEVGDKYRDIAKIQILNELSGGAMVNIIKDITNTF